MDMWTEMVSVIFARRGIGVTNARHVQADPVQELVLATARVRPGGMATDHARVASTSRGHFLLRGCWENTFKDLMEIVSTVKIKTI